MNESSTNQQKNSQSGCTMCCFGMREIFRKDESAERKKLDTILYNKAWVTHCFYTLYRIYEVAASNSLWH